MLLRLSAISFVALAAYSQSGPISPADATNAQYVVSTAAPSPPTVSTHGSAGSTTHGYCAALRVINANGPNSACSTTATITASQSNVLELVYQSGASTSSNNFTLAKITLDKP